MFHKGTYQGNAEFQNRILVKKKFARKNLLIFDNFHHIILRIGIFLDSMLDHIFACFRGIPISDISFDTALKEKCQVFTGTFSIISISDGAFHRN